MNYHAKTFFFFLPPVLEGEHRALCMLGKGFTTELLCPNPLFIFFFFLFWVEAVFF